MDLTWANDGGCISNRLDKSCGPGIAKQKRNCTDGTLDKCTMADRQQNVSCLDAGINQADCERVVGNWTNIGNCSAVGDDKGCGPGTVVRKRSCEDGTIHKCEDIDLQDDAVNCEDAGIPLPACSKTVGNWTTKGTCKSAVPGCGPGTATLIRDCTNGTIDKCLKDDMERTVSCKDAGIPQRNCTGYLKYHFSNTQKYSF